MSGGRRKADRLVSRAVGARAGRGRAAVREEGDVRRGLRDRGGLGGALGGVRERGRAAHGQARDPAHLAGLARPGAATGAEGGGDSCLVARGFLGLPVRCYRPWGTGLGGGGKRFRGFRDGYSRLASSIRALSMITALGVSAPAECFGRGRARARPPGRGCGSSRGFGFVARAWNVLDEVWSCIGIWAEDAELAVGAASAGGDINEWRVVEGSRWAWAGSWMNEQGRRLSRPWPATPVPELSRLAWSGRQEAGHGWPGFVIGLSGEYTHATPVPPLDPLEWHKHP